MDDQPARDGVPTVVALPSVINAANADQVYDRLYAAIESGTPVVIADLSNTALCDTSGVLRLLMIQQAAAACGGQLRLVIPPGAVTRRVLVLLEADHLLPVYSSIGEASQPSAGPQDPLAAYLPPTS